MTRRERLERKAERLQGWADKRVTTARATLQSHEIYRDDVAFNTQPGHIPQRARVIAQTERAYESLAKAGSMSQRAEGITAQLDRSIFSDDDNAIEALRQRIAEREAERDRVKAYNASCRQRKAAGDTSLLSEGQRRDLLSTARVAAYSLGKFGQFPSYHLTNLGATIRKDYERIEEIKHRQSRQAKAEANGGVTITQRGDYAVVTFAEKPEREILNALKAAGFRWGSGSWVGRADSLPAEVAA